MQLLIVDMRGMFETATGWFLTDPEFPYLVAGIMAAVAGLLLAVAILRTASRIWLIHRRMKTLAEVCGDSSDINACRRDFATQFPVIDSEMQAPASRLARWLGIDAFRFAWMEFSESLLEADSLPLRRNTVRPQSFFMRAVRGPAWLDFWGNVAVGVGLLFTFLGLVAALVAANAGINGGDMGAMQASLAGLLAAASAKFITSIMGVGLSLVLKIAEKGLSAWLHHEVGRVCRLFETGLLYVSPQTLAAKQVSLAQESHDLLKDQAHEIGMQFNRELKPLVQVMERASGEQARALKEGIGGIVGDEVKSLSDTLSGLAGTLGGLGGQLEQSGRAASAQIGEAASALHGLMDGLPGRMSEASAGAADAISRAGAESAERLSELQGGFARTAADLSRLAPALESWEAAARTSADTLKVSLRELHGTLETFGGTAERMMSANAELRDTIETSDRRIGTSLGAVTEANDNAGKLAASLRESRTGMEEAWSGYVGRFDAVDEALGRAVVQLGETYEGYHEGLQAQAGKLDSALAGAVNYLADLVNELQEMVEGLQAPAPVFEAAE